MPQAPILRAYLRSTESVPSEVDVPLRLAEGAIPARLRGTLYRNGPGKVQVFGTRYGHPFDGDGMVTRFAFNENGVRYRNRFVQTDEYRREMRAGRMLYRSFGTNLPGGLLRNIFRLRFKNAANTNIVHHGGKLLALWEGGLPHALDPDTLETLGRYDYEGRLRNRISRIGRMLAPELPFSAHPKRDVDTGELFNFGTVLGPTSHVASYRIDTDGRMAEPTFARLGKLSFVHDFVLTRNYCVYFLSAVSFRIAPMLMGRTTAVGSLSSVRDGSSSLLLLPRDGTPPIVIPAKAGFLFHFANGYEDERGRIVLDGMRMDSFPSATLVHDLLEGEDVRVPMAYPTRYVVDPEARIVEQSLLSEYPADLPTIDRRFAGRPYRHFWSVAGVPHSIDPFPRQIMHFDHCGTVTARDFGLDLPGEPLFVPASDSAGEGEGWLLTIVYREQAHRSDLYVLRPDNLTTVCRLELPHHLPLGFHGTWVPQGAAACLKSGSPSAGLASSSTQI